MAYDGLSPVLGAGVPLHKQLDPLIDPTGTGWEG